MRNGTKKHQAHRDLSIAMTVSTLKTKQESHLHVRVKILVSKHVY